MYIDQPGLRHYCEAEQLPCIVEVGAVVATMAHVRCMLLLLLLVASCVAGSAMANDANSEVDNSQSSFDYFYLVRCARGRRFLRHFFWCSALPAGHCFVP